MHNITQVMPAFRSVGGLYARVEFHREMNDKFYYVDSREIHQKCKYFSLKMFLFTDVSCIWTILEIQTCVERNLAAALATY